VISSTWQPAGWTVMCTRNTPWLRVGLQFD